MNQQPTYKTGDNVRIVNYGQLFWAFKGQGLDTMKAKVIQEDDSIKYFDIAPERVGQEDVVRDISTTQGVHQYSLVKNGAWYSESQLELIK